MSNANKAEAVLGSGTRDFTLGADPMPTWWSAKEALERWLLEKAIADANGDLAVAARLLDIPIASVYQAIQRHGLEAPSDARGPCGAASV